ncbi:MAG: hypothetical protein QG635_1027, partial [Bacteroidota bacterium]|nr:hypothetical protein [Bacteroidota bacterium]
GIAFVIQTNGIAAIGTNGSGIGFAGIPNSIAFEIDTYRNDVECGDTNGNHVAIFYNRKKSNTSDHRNSACLAASSDIPLLKADSSFYWAGMDYMPEEKRLYFYLDTNGNLSKPVLILDSVDLNSMLDLIGGIDAYIGITSSTGNAYENHDIMSWSYCSRQFSDTTSIEENEFYADNDISVYPNPFTESVNFEFYNTEPGYISLKIYSVEGAELAVIADGEYPSGYAGLSWIASGSANSIFFYKLYVNGQTKTGKIVLAK